MKVLVTGSTGFLGKQVIKALKLAGNIPIPLQHVSKNPDITNPSCFSKIPKTDVIIHLAAYIPSAEMPEEGKRCFEVNVYGTYNVLEYARQHSIPVVYASSISVYQKTTKLQVTERSPTQPTSTYGLSKLLGEHICQNYMRTYNLPVTILRFSSIYGSGQKPNSVIPTFIKQAQTRQPLTIHGSGKRSQDFIYVKDAATAIVLAAAQQKPGIYNIGSGTEVTTLQLAQVINNIFGPTKIVHTGTEQVIRFKLSISKARRTLSYKPAHTIIKGLAEYKT